MFFRVSTRRGGEGRVRRGTSHAAEAEEEPEEDEIDTVGVKACDDYVKAMVSCAEKMPPPTRKSMRDGAKQTAASFKMMAENKATKKSAENACRQAAQSLKQNPACK